MILASTSTSVAGNDSLTLADDIKKYDTAEFLQGQDLGLGDDDEKIIRKEKIMGRDFLKTTQEEFRSIGLACGLLQGEQGEKVAHVLLV